MDLNKDIAEFFLSDARDFLERYKLLRIRSTHIGMRCKLLIELLFSLECALKSVIFIESTEDENLTYKKVKKGSHKLSKLYIMLNNQSQKAFTNCIRHDLKDFIVDTRYLLEGRMFYSQGQGILNNQYYNTIANPSWLDEVSLQIADFIEYANSLNPFVFKITKFSEIDIDAELVKHDRLNAMITGKKK